MSQSPLGSLRKRTEIVVRAERPVLSGKDQFATMDDGLSDVTVGAAGAIGVPLPASVAARAAPIQTNANAINE